MSVLPLRFARFNEASSSDTPDRSEPCRSASLRIASHKSASTRIARVPGEAKALAEVSSVTLRIDWRCSPRFERQLPKSCSNFD